MAPLKPPAFSDLEYWDHRFSSTSIPFDWLVPATSLDSLILSSIRSRDPGACKILHIGCGSSELSYRLGELAQRPEDVWNTDYSSVAIERGRAVEGERHARSRMSTSSPTGKAESNRLRETAEQATSRMNWEILDLLDDDSVSSLQSQTFDLVVDKSTSDAISCGPDLTVPLLRPRTQSQTDGSIDSMTLHPLDILGINLARLTNPGGRWLAISYSADRFPFLPTLPSTSSRASTSRSESTDEEIQTAARYWQLEKKEEIEIEVNAEPSVNEGERPVFRPKEVNYLYVLVRTHVPYP